MWVHTAANHGIFVNCHLLGKRPANHHSRQKQIVENVISIETSYRRGMSKLSGTAYAVMASVLILNVKPTSWNKYSLYREHRLMRWAKKPCSFTQGGRWTRGVIVTTVGSQRQLFFEISVQRRLSSSGTHKKA